MEQGSIILAAGLLAGAAVVIFVMLSIWGSSRNKQLRKMLDLKEKDLERMKEEARVKSEKLRMKMTELEVKKNDQEQGE